MKAAVVYRPGGPDVFQIEERRVPELLPGWSLVKVYGCGVNHSEIFTRQGLSPSVIFPRVLGIECVGRICETTDPLRLPAGQMVVSIMGEMGRAFDGGYEEYVLLPNQQIYPVETGLSWEKLAAVPETGYTAYGSLRNLRIRETDRLLVRGATSGVGLAFAAMVRAAYPGVHLAGSCRDLRKSSRLLESGFDLVIEDKCGKLQTQKQYDKVLELVGPATMKDTFSHVSEGGIVCSTGQLGGVWDLTLEPIMELPANGYLTSFYSGNVNEAKLNEMLHFVEEHAIDIGPEKVFGLEEVREAHRYLESSGSLGKVILIM